MAAYSTDYGTQTLTYDYQQAATSQGFNKLNYKLFPAGIYSGLNLEYVNSTTVRISSGIVFIEDSTNAVGVRIDTSDYISIAVTPAVDINNPFIVLRFEWADQTDVFMGWEKVAYADIQADDIIVGRLQFNSGGALLNTFDTTRRIESILKENEDNQNLLKVYPTEPSPTNQFTIAAGVVNTNKGTQTVSGGNYPVGGITNTSGSSRNDLIYIDEDGAVQVEENFTIYGSKKVIAEIRRDAGRDTIRGSEIFMIEPTEEFPRAKLDTLDVTDKFITVNDDETGAGVTGTGLAGLEVERGTATNTRLEFQESDDTWRSGEIGSTQRLANIEDSPNDECVPSWDNTNKQLETSSYLKMDSNRQNYQLHNPSDTNSYWKLGWRSNIARLGFGGSGTGYQNGFILENSSDTQIAKFFDNGNFQPVSFAAHKTGDNTSGSGWFKLCTITATDADRIMLEGLGAAGITYNDTDHVGRCLIVISIQNEGGDDEANVQGYYYNEGGDRLITNVKCQENGGNHTIDVFINLANNSLDGWYAYCRAETTAITWSLTSDSDPGTGTGIRALSDKFQINTDDVVFKGDLTEVTIDAASDDPILRFAENGTDRSSIRHALSENAMIFASDEQDGSGYEFRFEGDIEATSLNLLSSKEYKTNIIDCNLSATEILNNVNIIQYNYKPNLTKNSQQPMIGFIAEDTDSLLSGLSQKEMITNNCIGLLIKAVQELKAENEELRNLINKDNLFGDM